MGHSELVSESATSNLSEILKLKQVQLDTIRLLRQPYLKYLS